jgi:hypothetical protein
MGGKPRARKVEVEHRAIAALRRVAMRYPGVEEGGSCTRAAFRARGKGFLYLGSELDGYNALLKLRDSQPEAAALQAEQPGCYKVGTGGWVTLRFGPEDAPPRGLLERWIDESYRIQSGS